MGGPIELERKGWVDRMLHSLCGCQLWPLPWPWPWIFKVIFWKSRIPGMGWPIDMEQKGCESIGCYTYFVTFNFDFNRDLDLGFSRSDLKKKLYLRNGMADWHGMKGMLVDRMLDSCCDFQGSPHPWPWPWIFKVKFEVVSQEWDGWLTWNKRGWVDRMLDSHCDFKLWPHSWPWPWIYLQGKILKLLFLRNGRVNSLGMKGMWVGYNVGCTMGLTLGHVMVHVKQIGQVMGQCETLTVSNLLANEWAIRSLI